MREAGANICQAYAAIPPPGEGTGWPARRSGRTPAPPRRGARLSIPPGIHGTASDAVSTGFVRSASPGQRGSLPAGAAGRFPGAG